MSLIKIGSTVFDVASIQSYEIETPIYGLDSLSVSFVEKNIVHHLKITGGEAMIGFRDIGLAQDFLNKKDSAYVLEEQLEHEIAAGNRLAGQVDELRSLNNHLVSQNVEFRGKIDDQEARIERFKDLRDSLVSQVNELILKANGLQDQLNTVRKAVNLADSTTAYKVADVIPGIKNRYGAH